MNVVKGSFVTQCRVKDQVSLGREVHANIQNCILFLCRCSSIEHLQKGIWEFNFFLLTCTLLSCPKNESIQHEIPSLKINVVGWIYKLIQIFCPKREERKNILRKVSLVSSHFLLIKITLQQKINNYFTWLVFLYSDSLTLSFHTCT